MDHPEKTRKAVALGVGPGEDTPQILATGAGYLADRIIEEAGKQGIPVHEDAPLAETLSKLDFGEYIPPELYGVVVDVLTYVDRIDSVKAKIDAGSAKHKE